MPKKLRIGIVGLGGIAQHAHMPGYEKLADQVEMVAGSDISEAAREKAAERFKLAKTYDDYMKMLENEELDAISVCTPPASHAPASIAAMDRGIHVLSEKPVAMTAEEAKAMVDAAKRNNVKFMVGFQSRFSPESRLLKEHIDAGELGDIYYAQASALRRRGIPGWGAFTLKEISRGGPLIDIGVHILDQTLWLMGSPKPVEVTGATYQKLGTRPGINVSWAGGWDPNKFETEDSAFAMVRFDNDATLYLETSWAINLPERHTIRLAGTKGGAETHPLVIFGETPTHLTDNSPYIPEFMKKQNLQDAKVKHFIDSIQNDTEPITTPDEIVSIAQLIDAIYESAETKKTVYINQAK